MQVGGKAPDLSVIIAEVHNSLRQLDFSVVLDAIRDKTVDVDLSVLSEEFTEVVVLDLLMLYSEF